MATDVVVAGQTFRRRHPWGAWGLVFLTLGIYYFVWYYKINDEARRYLDDQKIKPGIAVVAVLFGAILLYIPVLVSLYRTGERIGRMQERAGVGSRISSVLGVLAALLLSLNVPYMQSNLNAIWDTAAPTA